MSTNLIAQTYTVSGYVYDGENGESLIGAELYIAQDPTIGVVTNSYGYYAISLPVGEYELIVRYVGHQDYRKQIDLTENTKMDIVLHQGYLLETLEVSAKSKDENVESTDMGTVAIQLDKIKKLPALMGEVDLLKTIQLLPGVLSTGEGSSGFNVRGGSVDQNLVLLDEAVVYNSGHMFGFFSVFNPDALKNSTLIKGGMPAQFGGRISSVLDVQMREGNAKYYEAQGGIGLVSSRLTVEGPIVSDRSSFLLSARRTYLFDLIQAGIKGTEFEGTNYYFYDLNSKINYKINDNNRLFASGYFGRDVLKFNIKDRDFGLNVPYGNATATMRWNHVFSDRLFSNTSLIFNNYQFEFNGSEDDISFTLFSGIRDWNIKYDLDYFINSQHHVKTGVNYIYHKLTPNVFQGKSDTVVFESILEPKYAHEGAIYVADQFEVTERISVNAGLRYSTLWQYGPYTSTIDHRVFDRGELVKTYGGLEPRLSLRWSIRPTTSIKASYNRNQQYIHLVSNSSSSLPTDVWVSSTELVKPQIGDQWAVGIFKNLSKSQLKTSLEFYYRSMKNQIDYRDSYVDNASQDIELDFVFGRGYAYGAELFIEKTEGRLTGWLAYTYSKSRRRFDEIEEGRTYAPVFDRTHDLSIVSTYHLSDYFQLSGTLVYATGRPYTPLSHIYFIDQRPRKAYGPRNSQRLESYHRMDLALTYTPKPQIERSFTSSWTLSIYNLYNRKNTLFLDYDFEIEEDSITVEAYKYALFPIIPTVTWNFHWKSKKYDTK